MSTVERHEYVRLLDRIIAAAEAGDPSDLENVYWPDAVIWHNHEKPRANGAAGRCCIGSSHDQGRLEQ
jgi:hypothetical protein